MRGPDTNEETSNTNVPTTCTQLTSVISLEAAAAPSLRLIWGFLAPSSRARANVPMDLQTVTQYYTPKNIHLIAVNLLYEGHRLPYNTQDGEPR